MPGQRVVLSSVRLRNFLSFQDGMISFVPGLNVVVGPNGSGKTSIFHALKFALGSNQREDRYPKWSDFIRRGATTAEAEVVVIVDDQPVSFLRRVDRDGVPRSYMNGRRVGANELKTRAAELGLDVDNTLVFMPQERINALREMNPVEICRLVEEAAGLSKFRERIAIQDQSIMESRSRLEAAIAESQIVEHELTGLRSKLDRLQKKRELQSIARQLEIERRWSEFDSLQFEIVSLREVIEKTQSGEKSLLEELEQLEEQRRLKISEASQLTREMADIQKEIGNIEARIHEETRRSAQNEEENRRLLRDIEQMEKALSEAEAKRSRLVDDHRRLLSKIKQITKDEEDCKRDIDAQEQELDRVEEEIEAFSRWIECRNKVAEPFAQLKAQLESKRNESRRLQEELRGLRVELESLESEWGRLWSELENVDEKDILTRISEIDRRLAVLEEDHIKESGKIADLGREIESLQVQLAEVTRRIPDYVREFGAMVAEHGLKSVVGPLILQLTREQQYIQAVETVLRDDLLFAFITTDSADLTLLERLREAKNAQLPLILVSLTTASPARSTLPESPGVIGWLWDLLDIDENLRDLLRRAFGDHVLVNDYRTASRIAQRHYLRTVTTDGHLIVPGDGVLISHPRLEPTGLLSTAPLQARLNTLQNELYAAKNRYNEISTESERLKTERQNALRILSELSKTRTSWVRREDIMRRIPVLQAQIEQLDDELRVLQENAKKMEQSLREIDLTQPTELSKLKGRRSAIKMQLNKLRYRLSEIQKSHNESELAEKRTQDEIRAIEQVARQIESRLTETRQRLAHTGDAIASILKTIEELKERQSARQRLYAEKRASLESVEQDSESILRKIQDMEHKLDESRQGLAQSYKKIEILEEELKSIRAELAGTERPAVVRALRIVHDELIRIHGKIDEYADVTESVAERENTLEEKMVSLRTKIDEISREIRAAESAQADIKRQYRYEIEKALNRVADEVNQVLSVIEFRAAVKFELTDCDGQYGVRFKTRIKSDEYSSISAGSGGERSLIALSLILALQRFNPAPVYALDEIDIFLDATNTEMMGRLFHECARTSQFILFTPARSTQLLKHADKSIGVASPGGRGPSVIVEAPVHMPTNV